MAALTGWFQIRCHCGKYFPSEALWTQHKLEPESSSGCPSDCQRSLLVTSRVKIIPASARAVQKQNTAEKTATVNQKAISFVCSCGKSFQKEVDWKNHKMTAHPNDAKMTEKKRR